MTHYCVSEQQTDSAHIWPSSIATATSSLVSFHEDVRVNVLPKRFLAMHLQSFNKTGYSLQQCCKRQDKATHYGAAHHRCFFYSKSFHDKTHKNHLGNVNSTLYSTRKALQMSVVIILVSTCPVLLLHSSSNMITVNNNTAPTRNWYRKLIKKNRSGCLTWWKTRSDGMP